MFTTIISYVYYYALPFHCLQFDLYRRADRSNSFENNNKNNMQTNATGKTKTFYSPVW